MNDARNPLATLQDLQHFLGAGSLEEGLTQHVAAAAALVGAASCSVMLLNSGEGEDMRMSVYARHGALPDVALTASVAHGEGIAGSVLASGVALCLDDIGRSAEYAALARRSDGGALMCVPLRIDGRIVGVLNAANPAGAPHFGATELRLLETLALFIGKAIQVQQLQRLLDSRFAQLALLQDARRREGQPAYTAYRNPQDVVRLLARSFFREMTKAGFEPGQIVGAVSELIDQLHHHLHRKKKQV